ncbi:MAG: hypothetical protein IEMM0003_0051 [bacterium]|nr:MAG: hypothetical protein IEMM0003_0051 [bacterium]
MILSLLLLAAASLPANTTQLKTIKKDISATEQQIKYKSRKIARLKHDLKYLNRKIMLSKRKVKRGAKDSKNLDSTISRITSDKTLIKKLKQKADSQTKKSIQRIYEHFIDGKSSSEDLIIENLTALYFLYKSSIVKKLEQAEKGKENYLIRLKRRKRSVETIKLKIEKEMRKERRLAEKRKRLALTEMYNKNRLLIKRKALIRKKNYLERILKQLVRKRRPVKTEKMRRIPGIRISRKNPFLKYKGRLALPVKGRIEKRFGIYKDRDYNVYIRHTGIEIAAKANSYIRASAKGKVVYAGYVLGYGKTVIIRHRGDFFTIYGRLNKIKTKKGKIVGTKNIIGTAGVKPIYFGIRYKDKAVNPSIWIRRRH